jgi:hypothetical protein
MTYTAIVFALQWPMFLVMGSALLNAVFQPPYCKYIDFVCMLVCVAFLLFVMAPWAMALNYGLETI